MLKKSLVSASVLAICGACASPLPQSGLLLGVAADSGYQTPWIAPAGKQNDVVARQPGIAVPRNDGFWKLDIARRCFFTLASEDDESQSDSTPRYLNHDDALYRQPLGSSRIEIYGSEGFQTADSAQIETENCAPATYYYEEERYVVERRELNRKGKSSAVAARILH